MGYPEEVLAPEEGLLVHRHPHWKTIVTAFLVGIVSTIVAGAAIAFITAATLASPLSVALNIVVVALWLAAILWLVLAPLVRWGTTHFVVTDQRVMFRTGVFKRTGIDIPLLRINTVRFEHGFIDRLVGTGTLIIESASDDPLSFKDIPEVEKVHSLIYSELNKALDKGNA